jgi:hypothetical protein
MSCATSVSCFVCGSSWFTFGQELRIVSTARSGGTTLTYPEPIYSVSRRVCG